MYTFLQPITNILIKIFMAFYNFVTGMMYDPSNMTPAQIGTGLVLAVFLITLLVRLLILPLTIKQMKSTAKMQEVQPLVKKVQEKYKGNPEKANMEVMKIYKENKVSMSGGCLPLLIQMPILFALYDVFRSVGVMPQFQDASFLWIHQLSGHDPLYVLPVLSGLTTYLSSYLMQKGSGSGENSPVPMGTMNIVMGCMLGFMSLRFPALLVIYWITGNLIQIVQTYFLIILPKKRKMVKASSEANVIDVTPKKNNKKKK